jgi:hypothetical protein
VIRKRVRIRVLLALAGLAAPAGLLAQEAVTEPPDRWRAEVGLSFNGSGGNQQLTLLTTNLGITHLQTDVFEMGVRSRFRYGESEGSVVARNIQGALNFDLYPEAGWSPFVFMTAEQDAFRKLDLRWNGGAGVKRTFWRNDWDEVSLSGAALYSYENLQVPDSLGTGISGTARWSWRARARKRFAEGTQLEQVVFFQPAWDRLADYQLESSTSGRLALSRSLALTASLLYERDNTPAPEVKPDDWSVAVGFSMTTTW